MFILGDLDSSYLAPAAAGDDAQAGPRGAGLVMLGGYHSLGPGGYAGTPLGEVLPVELGGRDIGQVTEPFLPVLTPEGVRHPIFANIADFFPTRARRAEDGRAAAAGRLHARRAAAARGHACWPRLPAEAGSMPRAGRAAARRGRTAVFSGDTTRKWQQGPRALDQESPFLRFWGQMVRWLAGRSDAGRGPGQRHRQHRQGRLRARASRSASRPSCATRRAKAAADAKVDGQGPRARPARPEQIALSPVPGPSGHLRRDHSSRATAGRTRSWSRPGSAS